MHSPLWVSQASGSFICRGRVVSRARPDVGKSRRVTSGHLSHCDFPHHFGGTHDCAAVVSFPADFSPSVGKSTSGNPPIPFWFKFAGMLVHCIKLVWRHIRLHCCQRCNVQCTMWREQWLRDASNDWNTVNRNGIGGLPDVLFTTEGEKSAGSKTTAAALYFH